MKLEPDAKRRIAQKLRSLREERGMTQADLGNLLGRAYTTIASWESGKGQPDADTFLRLMAFYRVENVTAEFGYGGEDALSRRERALVELFRAMDAPAKDLVWSVAQELSHLTVAPRCEESPVLRAVARGTNSQTELDANAAVIDSLPDEGWTPDGK